MRFPEATGAGMLAACVLVAIASGGDPEAASEPPPRPNPIAEALPLIFDSESIRLTIIGDSLEVRGTYFLLCRERIAEPIPLFYPFPRDSLMGGARMISLLVRQGSRSALPVPARWEQPPRAPGVRWWMPPCSGDTLVAEAMYRQKTSPGYARYIVTSTRGWGRPLRRAEFEISLPPGATPLEFSFPFERRQSGASVFYRYLAEQFYPDHDIVFRWRL